MFSTQIESRAAVAGLVRAGPLLIDLTQKQATLNGLRLELSPLLLSLLTLLASQPGRLITRSEIKRHLWPYAERIDTERRLNTAMRALREALGDDAESPHFIRTERGFGYRWIGSPQHGRVRPALVATAALALLAGATPFFLPSPATRRVPDAWAVIRAQTAMDSWRSDPQPAQLQAAANDLDRAIAVSGEQPSLLVLKAQLALEARWDWKAAEHAYRRALAEDESNSDAKLGLAWLEVNRGNGQAALQLAIEMMGDSVASGDRRADLGWLLIRIGRADLAAQACTPNAQRSLNILSCAHTAFAAQGRFEEARRTALDLMRMRNADVRASAEVQRLPARAAYGRFLEWRVHNFLPAAAPEFQRAQLLADAGHEEAALDTLARSVAAREPLAVKIYSTPSFAVLRQNPRYQALVRQVGVTS
jgi:DNA-binding winged helix-turn-helix (wHTH) protein